MPEAHAAHKLCSYLLCECLPPQNFAQASQRYLFNVCELAACTCLVLECENICGTPMQLHSAGCCSSNSALQFQQLSVQQAGLLPQSLCLAAAR